jgi:hypothetical protein
LVWVKSRACTVVCANYLAEVNRFWCYYDKSDDGLVGKGDFNTDIKDPDSFNISDGIGSMDYKVDGLQGCRVSARSMWATTATSR